MANENPNPKPGTPHQPASPNGRGPVRQDASNGEGVNLVEISRQIQAVRQVVNQNGPRLNNLENGLQGLKGVVGQLGKATKEHLASLSKDIKALPCQTTGQCPPAQRSTQPVVPVAPPDAIREVGRLDENNRVVLNEPPRQPEREEPAMTTTAGRDRPVRDADDDELADELLERQERRMRREQRRAQLEASISVPQMPQVGVSASLPPMPNMTMRERMQQGLAYQMQDRTPWYKNKFFHTTWGFVLLFLIVTFWDVIMGWVGYAEAGAEPHVDENRPAVTESIDLRSPGDVDVVVEGVDAEMRRQYEEWRSEVNFLLDDAYTRIILAREKVAAVRETSGNGRLYPAEDDFLEDATRLLDEAAGMMIVQESEDTNG